MVDEVIGTILNRIPRWERSVAEGWRVARLKGKVYPGLVPHVPSFAIGRLYSDLTFSEWKALDSFEDVEYRLGTVRIPPAEKSIMAYIWPGDCLDEDWSLHSLAGRDLDKYLEQCALWRSRYDHVDGR